VDFTPSPSERDNPAVPDAAPAPEADVSLDHVTKQFGEQVAVDDLSLDIEHGEFFSLLGPSGCGKTTTLRMIGGFEEPSTGVIQLGGRDVTNLPSYRRDVNTVFQSYALFPHLDVFENVAFGLRRKKVPGRDLDERVKEMLRIVDLPGYERRKPSQLSGGQQQRVALARALVNQPRLLLLDEPLGALDLKLRRQMQLELKRIQQAVQITFLYVTHDQEEAMTMSNRLAVMHKGRIEQVGPPEAVYDKPVSEFVAGFLGASNLLSGQVKERSDDSASVVVTGGSVVRVPADRVPEGTSVRVGVRPEKIHIEAVSAPPPDNGWNAVEGDLRDVTYIGVSHQFTVDGPAGSRLTVYEQNRGTTDIPHPGERVRIRWRPEYTFAVTPGDSGDGDEEGEE
jgi:spermidine/putrescine transport system ATP-binding protein